VLSVVCFSLAGLGFDCEIGLDNFTTLSPADWGLFELFGIVVNCFEEPGTEGIVILFAAFELLN
jgi:hypothetical protein